MAIIAFPSQVAYSLVTEKVCAAPQRGGIFSEISQAAKIIVLVAMVLVPILTLVANTFERRGSFRVVITQEYAPLAATMFYVAHGRKHHRLAHRGALHYSGIQA